MAGKTWLLADIGGTHTRLAYWQPGNAALGEAAVFNNGDYPRLEALLNEYMLAEAGPAPQHALLAVAGPISGQAVRLTNRGWLVSVDEVAANCRFNTVRLLNDFTAISWSLPALMRHDVVKLSGGESVPGAAKAVLGPGTGLGVSGLLPHPDGWIAVTGEGGHVTLAGSSSEEDDVLQRLRALHGHVSAERALSGPGLVDLYRCLAAAAGRPVRWHWPEEITANRATDALAAAAVSQFFKFLGTVAGDVALTFGAQGGVFLAGGLLPKLLPALQASGFTQRFTDKGRFSAYLKQIPVYVVTHPYPGLLGLQTYLQFCAGSPE